MLEEPSSNNQIVYGVTWTDNLPLLVATAHQRIADGIHSKYLRTPHIDPLSGAEADGVADQIELYMTKVMTAYAEAGACSLCLIKLPLRDFVGDPLQPDYVPFVSDMGMTTLAVGTNNGPQDCYDQIRDGLGNQYLHPDARLKWEQVLPNIQPVDPDTLEPAGEPQFQMWVRFARSYKDGVDSLA